MEHLICSPLLLITRESASIRFSVDVLHLDQCLKNMLSQSFHDLFAGIQSHTIQAELNEWQERMMQRLVICCKDPSILGFPAWSSFRFQQTQITFEVDTLLKALMLPYVAMLDRQHDLPIKWGLGFTKEQEQEQEHEQEQKHEQ